MTRMEPLLALLVAAVMVVAAFVAPWLKFVLTVALAKGLAVLGILLLLRAGRKLARETERKAEAERHCRLPYHDHQAFRFEEARHDHFDDRDARADCPGCAELVSIAGG